MKQLRSDDFKKYSFLSNPTYNQSGTHYAFNRAKVLDHDNYETTIFLAKHQEKPLELTSGEKDGLFIWEDDSNILFSSSRKKKEGFTNFYRININGGEAKEAFSLPFPVSYIEKISSDDYLFLANVKMSRTEFSIDGEKEKTKEEKNWEADVQEIDQIPFWSNGKGFISGKRTHMFLFNEKTKNIASLSEKFFDVQGARFNKNKNEIIFIANSFEKIADTFTSLYSYSLEKKEAKDLLAGFDEKLRVGSFDFDEKQIIFTCSTQSGSGLNSNPKIFSLDFNNTKPTIILDMDRSLGSAVGTDSRMGGGNNFKIYKDNLYFTMLTDFSSRICKINTDGKNLEYLSEEGHSFDCFDISKKGMISSAFVDQNLGEIYSLSQSLFGGSWQKETSFHDEFHKEHERSIPKYKKLMDKDGFEIDGWIMPPTNLKEGETYPAILHIHGGPKTVLSGIYHHEMQLWANNGYYVIYCNPRGSDGKGNEFADIRGKYGTVDYDNLMFYLDEMLEEYPSIDRERTGVTGGSYGGFMTNWIVGQTGRFKAAATQRSISNWISKTYMSDIGYYFNTDQVLAQRWDEFPYDVKKMWDNSPLKYAHNATTPTLIIHSDEDYRCTVPEGYQMFTALTLAGVDTKMCVFHGETHELSRSGRPKNRIRRMDEILNWMDKYLK